MAKLSLLLVVLLSLLKCSDYDEAWVCSQASVYEYTNSSFSSVRPFELNPPKLTFFDDGPMDVCPRKNVQIVASLLCKKNPPTSIKAICKIGAKQIFLNNYNNLNHKYTSNTTDYLPLNSNQNLSLDVSCEFEISWTPLVPYEDESELKKFINKYLDKIEIHYSYYEFKP